MLDGTPAEVPTGKVMAAIRWLDSAGTRWDITVKPGAPGFSLLTPHPDFVAHIKREVERDEAEDIAAERALEPRRTSSPNIRRSDTSGGQS